MKAKLNIAVCGAGIGGLASAILLKRAGHSVAIVEQFDAPQPVGSGLMLQATGLAVLREMGLADEIIFLGSKLERLWGISEPSGRVVLDVRFAKLREGLFGLGVQRPMLFDQLYRAATREGVTFLTSKHVESVDAATGDICLETGEYIRDFDLVVDALGVRSSLTKAPRRKLPYGALWTTLPWPEDSPFDATALEQRYRAARQMTGVMASGRIGLQAPESLTYFWSIRTDGYESWRNAPLDAWKDEAEKLWPATRQLLDQINDHDQLTYARYRHRTHSTPVGGDRLVHIGDAWHAASPQLGQGANMALLDAYALATAMDGDVDLAAALRQYVRLRAGHIRLYQLMSWLFTPVYQGDGRMTPWLRDYLAAPLSRIPPAPALLAGMVSGGIGAPLKNLRLRP